MVSLGHNESKWPNMPKYNGDPKIHKEITLDLNQFWLIVNWALKKFCEVWTKKIMVIFFIKLQWVNFTIIYVAVICSKGKLLTHEPLGDEAAISDM